ncbi:hypothetical protein NQ314_008241 [Rhamnusium bicolor]|uniref:Uncharacterized protein n=1 Tax=Rhamnusium bicolor TaxID=1586634 RepID=A0AAV8YCV3_9CUCU|nr:hypothetical protein NQ314_008241 [Rhamnusium bicolor]
MELLHILHPHLHFLPMQARTLMKTCPRIMKSDSMTKMRYDQLTKLNEDRLYSCYETIAENLASIKTILAQHCIILNQLQRHAQLTNTGALMPPTNLPDFPIKT